MEKIVIGAKRKKAKKCGIDVEHAGKIVVIGCSFSSADEIEEAVEQSYQK